MAPGGFCVYLVLFALAQSVASVAVPDVWPDIGDGFLSRNLLQTSGLNGIGPSVSYQLWSLIDLQSSFDLRLVNSTWSGPAETSVYRRGDSVHLQVSGSSASDKELFIKSCYATSSNSTDKSRSALIINNGCVSSKQSSVEFISRQPDSINLLLNTSHLTFSQVFVRCSVVFSSAVTQDTKSCNYNKNDSLWIELSGQTSVCECCASKCKGPPSFGGPLNELKALVSTGPFTIKEELHEDPLNSSHVDAFIGIDQSGSRFPSSMEKGWIIASATMSDRITRPVPYSPPWLPQLVASDGVMVLNQDLGNALSVWLPGLSLDVSHSPVLELVIDLPQQKSASRLVGVSSQGAASSEGWHGKTSLSETNLMAHDEKSRIPEHVGEVYMDETPALRNDWDLGEFLLPKEELRGDVFINYKWPEQHNFPNEKVQVNSLASALLEKPDEQVKEIEVLKQKEKVFKEVEEDDFGILEYIKKTLTFRQASDGSRSFSYEEEERRQSVGEQGVKKSRLEMDRRKENEEESLKAVEMDLMPSLLDVVR